MHEDEGLPALGAAVGPLPAVRPLVHPQTALLREPLAALGAPERLLARVRPVVDAEVGRALEAFPADAAPECTLPFVALLVQLELVETPECLSALHADETPSGSGNGFVETVLRIIVNAARLASDWSFACLPLRLFLQMRVVRVIRESLLKM